MGGSGGSGYSPPSGAKIGGGGGSPSGVECVIELEARIHGPVPGVADNLEVGEQLVVRRIDGPPIRVGLFNAKDEQAGSLAGLRELTRILECMEGGYSYVAAVTSIEGSLIQVQITNA